VTGIVGIFFKSLAYTVAFSLFGSLIVALTVIPVLASRLLRRRPGNEATTMIPSARRVFQRVEQRYEHALSWALGHRKTMVVISAGIFAGSLAFLPIIGQEFMPTVDEGEAVVNLTMPVGTSLPTTDRMLNQLEDIVLEEVPEAENVYASSGGDSFYGWGGGGSHTGSLRVQLVDKDKRSRSTSEIADDLRAVFRELPVGEITITEISSMGGGSGIFGGRPLQIEISGYDLDASYALAQEIQAILRDTEGVVEPDISYESGEPEFQIEIDRNKASALGLNLSQIANTVQIANAGTVASRYREAGDEYDIRVRLQPQDRQSLTDVGQITVLTPWGDTIPLRSVARIRDTEGPVSIDRKEQERIITVSGGLSGRDLGSVSEELEARIAELDVPPDLRIRFAGEQEEMAESFQKLFVALALAIILVYMVMAAQFESLRYPFVVLLSIPLGLIGVIAMLLLSGTSLNVVSLMGLIMLAGIVVNNGIVLISYVNLLRERGRPLMEAVKIGAVRRLRPILMTTLTTVLGLVPMALGYGSGAEIWAPMARTVVGGLSVATVFTLLFMPTLYVLLGGEAPRES